MSQNSFAVMTFCNGAMEGDDTDKINQIFYLLGEFVREKLMRWKWEIDVTVHPSTFPFKAVTWLNSLQAFLFSSSRVTNPPGTLCHSKSGRSLPSVAAKPLMDYRVPSNPDEDNFHWALSSLSSPVVTATCESLSLCDQMCSMLSILLS